MKNNLKGKIFNLKLFKKLMVFVKPYSFYYRLVLITAILLSVFSIITPYLLKIIVDDYIRLKDYNGMKIIISFMFISLVLSVTFQILFVYFANFLGQKVIKDLRIKLFDKIIGFKLDYFKRNPIAYALALEGKGFNDNAIQYALEISNWYSKENIDLTMQQLKKGRNEKHLSKS